jgi:quercetin 2,3-dioxygenase
VAGSFKNFGRQNHRSRDKGGTRVGVCHCKSYDQRCGSVRIGDAELKIGQVGWIDRPTDVGTSVLRVVAGESGARVVLYAGQPQGDPIVSYGPFIGDSKQDIARLFAEYQSGRFPRLSELKKQQV